MFKEFKENILLAFENLNHEVKVRIDFLASKINADTQLEKSVSNLSDTVKYQAKLIDTLLNHLYENDKTMDTVVFIPYRGKPVVYKDGKLISTDLMTRFTVDWSYDCRTEVTVDNN